MRDLDLTIVDTAELPARAAERIAAIVRESTKARGHACLALAGGTTPRAVHLALAALPDIPWPSVFVFFGDERCVPPDHPDSNYRMAKESLLDRVAIPPAQVHRPSAELADRAAAAEAYESVLPEALDLVLLGIGEDGHTASLFPGSPALNERKRRCIPVIGPKPPPERLTLTPPVLESARARGARHGRSQGRPGRSRPHRPLGSNLDARAARAAGRLVRRSRGGAGPRAPRMNSASEPARAVAKDPGSGRP